MTVHRHGGRSGRRYGGSVPREHELPELDGIDGWLAGRLPDGWFEGVPEVSVDRDEIIIIGALSAPGAAEDAGRDAAAAGRIRRFREETREQRIEIALEMERTYGRKVAWGARVGDRRELFTTIGVPVMTRLRQPERQVLDTLVDAGVARSRSEALAWCVRLVGQHQDDWIKSLRDALVAVEQARAAGPDVTT